jgi:non-specific serine/threonine protein kinase
MSVTVAPSVDTSDTLAPGFRLRQYEITGVVGRGGFGTVYTARRSTDGLICALKEYLPVAIAGRSHGLIAPRSVQFADALAVGVKGFLREAELLSELSHPALVEVYDAWEENGTGYLAMAYYPGKTLRARRMAATGALSEQTIREWMLPVFDAVLELHAHRIIHRDISPDNILVSESGTAVLLDLGSARQVVGGMTQALTTVLKPGFAPIEQYVDDGSMSQGRWTDVYGLAGTIYFLATGKVPLAATSRLVRDQQPSVAAGTTPGQVSEAFCAAVDKGLAVRAIDRFKSVGEFRAAIGWGSDHPLVRQAVESSDVASADLPRSLRPEPAVQPSRETSPVVSPSPMPDAEVEDFDVTVQPSEYATASKRARRGSALNRPWIKALLAIVVFALVFAITLLTISD